jgi:thiamine biosynthesis lipoprotein ApbE
LQEHIFNPFGTIKNKNKRVTVFGPSCAIADAYATYLSIYEDGELYSNDYYIQYDE